ncbi:MAG: DUF4956 domain-containing protein [Cytophagaceae bacterium]|nr:DUF4956 domain-containing protein [Cytophagaceae bacterium]
MFNQEITDISYFALTYKDVLGRLLVALLCGIIISVFYRLTYKGLSYSTTFVNSLILLTMITTVVIMVIGDNTAAAFGLVGAMSIIRFRTAVKDIQDIIFIFFSLGIGLACGRDSMNVALTSTLVIGIIFYLIVKLNISAPKRRDFLLQLMLSGGEQNVIEPVLNKYCSRFKVVNVKAVGEAGNDMLEVSYYVKLKSEDNSQKFIKEIKAAAGVKYANLFFDEE